LAPAKWADAQWQGAFAGAACRQVARRTGDVGNLADAPGQARLSGATLVGRGAGMDIHSHDEGANLAMIAGLMAAQGLCVHWDQQPLEGGHDPAYGTVRWRTIFDADQTPGTSGMVVGVAEFGPGDRLLAHRHSAAEVYLGLEGEGVVTIAGQDHRMAPGVALFVPGDAEHATVAGPAGLRFLYVFAKDRFSEVHYSFSPALGL